MEYFVCLAIKAGVLSYVAHSPSQADLLIAPDTCTSLQRGQEVQTQ